MSATSFETSGRRRAEHIVTGIRHLTESAFVLSFTRGNFDFRAGQHIIAGIAGEMDQREYSIYSGEKDANLEILVREISEGNISVKLGNCECGQKLNINGPFGSFGIERSTFMKRKHIFIATGTGISPFHSIVKSYPGIDYTLIHGVSFREEAYESETYDTGRYVLCTSKEAVSGRQGRVTAYLENFTIKDEMLFYLCGNSGMIHDVKNILKNKKVPAECIFTEVYF